MCVDNWARLLLVLTALRRTEAQPVQRSQAKLGQGWHIARVRSRQRLGAPTRSTLQPISDSQRLLPLGFRSGHTSRRERNPGGAVAHFGVLEPALVSGIVHS